ncbi:hypothetical protein FXL08_08690 [Campylobacter jejuni]|uniref:hypothetical protein n=1 Tax=Campylobacter jejuni TaxID=197 RepID=UPI0008736365|nr:hypothetical protein [Campylobacter jejuni]ECO3964093.1 hypothetical protein [Campylobacter jejuni]OEW55154.1 hypothetical protein AJM78_05690 [Campylobacter jejuni]HEF5073903.1 hypothetical protein [Campylobacter jejuni]
MESIGIGLFINSLYGLQTGDSRAFIILIESLLILTVVALSSIFLKEGEKMDGYNIAILIGAITFVFGTLVLVAHYLNDKHTNESEN